MDVVDEMDRHTFNVGRVALTATDLEAEVARIIHASHGHWDNSDEWMPWNASTGKRMRAFQDVCLRFPHVEGLAGLHEAVAALLDRRGEIVHAQARYRLFVVDADGRERVNPDPFTPEQVHHRTGKIGPLPSDEEIRELLDAMHAQMQVARRLAGRAAAAHAAQQE